jgi:hypothetical protein
MTEFPTFESASDQLRSFLLEQQHPGKLHWVFRDDLFLLSHEVAVVHYPPPLDNITLAEKVYAEGRNKGLVEVSAVAVTKAETFVSVWYPRSEEDEVQGWDTGVKMSIPTPLARARLTKNEFMWKFWQLTPAYRHYQSTASFIGSRAWAAA